MAKFDIAAWPRELERQLAALPLAIHAAAAVGGATAAAIARAKVGHYQPSVGPYPAWEPLAESTVADKTRQGYGPDDNPLLRTGEMRDSISEMVETKRLETLMTVYSDDPVMRFQEEGTSRIPPRPVIGPAMLEAEPIIQRELGRSLAKTLAGERYAPSNIGFVAFQEGEE